MGAFDANRTDQITIRDEANWEPHEQVTARTIVRAGDEEWVLNQQMQILPKSGNRKQRRAQRFQRQQDAGIDIKSQLGATNRLWVQKMLTGWTFTRNGRPVEFLLSGNNEVDDRYMMRVMAEIDQSYIDFIYEQIMNAQPKQAVQDAQDEEEDDDQNDEGGSPFFGDASNSTDGDTGKTGEESSPASNQPRNFLSKS